jgi:decaprenylphospho-beta-D-erythro-pentofuranosid-2-ulose 2-reductase
LEFRNKTVLILGGNSDVGKSLAKDFGKLGSNLLLTSRKEGQLDSFKSDLEIRNKINCDVQLFDVLDFKSHDTFYKNLKSKPDIVITCIGYLDNQEKSENSFEESLKSIQTNFTGLVSILNIVSNDFERRKSGIIIGISSVAGDRGRGSNYIYGCSKSGFTSYLSGLRNRLFSSGVKVITVKPGFIKTKMTNHLDLPKVLTASSDDISKDIINSIKKGKYIIYSKWFWKWIMLFIILVPESIFKKLKF